MLENAEQAVAHDQLFTNAFENSGIRNARTNARSAHRVDPNATIRSVSDLATDVFELCEWFDGDKSLLRSCGHVQPLSVAVFKYVIYLAMSTRRS
jgi:hypothetical protein